MAYEPPGNIALVFKPTSAVGGIRVFTTHSRGERPVLHRLGFQRGLAYADKPEQYRESPLTATRSWAAQ